MTYYGTRLSENISRRDPEGYLICLNVPVARSGTQEYLPEELGLPPGGPPIPVLRPEEEVFAPACAASFEGMPVTDGHPAGTEGVTAENIAFLQKGHAHNVRRGSGEESDLLLADLIITDPALIDRVLKDGRREISCGYNYALCEERGAYVQRQIRGNHVAVVDAGRAGRRVCIKDREPERRGSMMKTNRNSRALARVLTRMARDGETEELAELIGEVLESEAAEAPETPETPEAPEAAAPDFAAAVLEKLDALIALLTAAAADEDPAEDPADGAEALAEAAGEAAEAVAAAADPLEQLALELAAGEPDGLSDVIDPADDACGEEDPDRGAADALRAAIRAVRPALARMPAKKRDRAAADLARGLRAACGRPAGAADAYAALRGARRAEEPSELGRRIMRKRNANWRDA